MDIESDLNRIEEQERTLVFDRFGMDTAWALGSRLRATAAEHGLPVAIDISLHAMPIFYTAMEGVTPDNPSWVRRKRNTVLRFFRSSYGVGLSLTRQKTSLQEKFGLSDADFAAHGGSFPIRVEGAGVVGAVTVSGLPQRDDHSMVVAALADLLGRDAAALRLP